MTRFLEYAAVSHTAMVVTDLDASLDRYHALFGLTFAPVFLYPGRLIAGPRRGRVDVPLTWSVEGPPHLEVITRTPGTMWEDSGQHHVGLWSDDVAADAAHLESQGFDLEYTVGGPGQPVRGFAYLRDEQGMRIELTSTQFRGTFATWLSGHPLELG